MGSQIQSFYLKALFDYNPKDFGDLPTVGLKFKKGDILHAINGSDENWWKARQVLPSGKESEVGIIPSKSRWEKKQKARARSIVIIEGLNGNSLNRKVDTLRKIMEPNNKDNNITYNNSGFVTATKNILSYEKVHQIFLHYKRPIFIFGDLKSRIEDDLIAESPENFEKCNPFKSPEFMKKMFAKEKNQNIYTNSQEKLNLPITDDKHFIMDLNVEEIKILERAQIFPIVICVRPMSVDQLIEWNKRMSEDEALRILNEHLDLEEKYAEHISITISAYTPEEVFQKCKEYIEESIKQKVWVPIET